MTRNQEEVHGQDNEYTKREVQEKEPPGSYNTRTFDGHWMTGHYRTSDAWSPHQPDGRADESYSGWTSDNHQPPDNQHRSEIRCHLNQAETSELRPPPDDWTPTSDRTTDTHRTSHACLRIV